MNIRENVLLAPYTTFHIGGPARYFVEAESDADIVEAVKFAHTNTLPIFILGGGSNLLISDRGYDGLVIHMTGKALQLEERDESTLVIADAGMNWDKLVSVCVEAGLWGVENLSGIPGNVGATPVQNIGAYGAEVGSFIEWVDVYDMNECAFKRLSKTECKLAYRDSIFKQEEGKSLIVVRVAYQLSRKGERNIEYKDLIAYAQNEHILATIVDVRNAVLTIRERKFPLYDGTNIGTAGSFFKNPVVSSEAGATFSVRFPSAPVFPQENGNMKLSAAWIIDHILEMKGVREGNVGTWEAQALVMINYGGATATEVAAFAKHIILRALNETGIILESEVVYTGDIKIYK